MSTLKIGIRIYGRDVSYPEYQRGPGDFAESPGHSIRKSANKGKSMNVNIAEYAAKINTLLLAIATSPNSYERTPVWCHWQIWFALQECGVLELNLDPQFKVGTRTRWLSSTKVLIPSIDEEKAMQVFESYRALRVNLPSKKEGPRGKRSTIPAAAGVQHLPIRATDVTYQGEPRMDEYTCALSSEFVVRTNDNIRRFKGKGAVETADHIRNMKLIEENSELRKALGQGRTSDVEINELKSEIEKLTKDLEGSEGRRLKMAEEISQKNAEIRSLNKQLDKIRKQLGIPVK